MAIFKYFIAVVLFYAVQFSSAELHFSIYKLECINEQDTNYTANITCFIKTISRGLNVLTSLSDFIVPLNYINVNIACSQKSSSNSFNSVIFNNSFEVCSALGRDSPLLKLTMPLISKFAPKFIHACPYEGRRIGVENIPIDLSLLPLIQMSSIPKGDYRLDISFWDKYWNIVHWIRLYGALQQKRFKKVHAEKPPKSVNTSSSDSQASD